MPTETGDSAPITGDSAPIIEVDCTEACADTISKIEKAVCYSCRCKSAMDGWLPSTDEFQCANGQEIVVYTASAHGTLSEVTGDQSTCANPTLLYGTCTPGGRLGQLSHGSVTAKWICRRNHYVEGAAADETVPYDDVGLILYNQRNGASCWFDDVDGTGIAGRNMPNIDLTDGDTDNREAFLGYYYNTNGRSCTACHDNDPFIYTPYLQSVHWDAGSYASGSFVRIALDGTFEQNGTTHLVSPNAAACTSCHRISSAATCSSWAPDSFGAYKRTGHEARVVDASSNPESALWWLGTWMPYVYEGGEQERDHDAWESRYGLARDTVTSCCAQPGVNTTNCQWEPTPTE